MFSNHNDRNFCETYLVNMLLKTSKLIIFQDEVDTITKQKVDLLKQLESARNQESRTKVDLETVSQQKQDLDRINVDLNVELIEAKKDYSKMRDTCEKINTDLDSTRQEVDKFEQMSNKLQKELYLTKQDEAQLNFAVKKAKDEKRAMKRDK